MITNLCFSLDLESIHYDDKYPELVITLDDVLLVHDYLNCNKTLKFDVMLNTGTHTLNIELANKGRTDTKVDNTGKIIADKAIYIKNVTIEGYALSDFLHQATYYPAGRDSIKSNYLGWNGVWKLNFDTPIFSWIHKTQNMGWIYDAG
jgi:hypothetical protein